jgi:hypothetical protein
VADSQTKLEPTTGNLVNQQCTLRQLARMLNLNRQYAGTDLDAIHLPHRDREQGQQVGLPG